MKRFSIVRSKAVRFSWKPHRLTLRCNPPIYHWFWFAFGFHDVPLTPRQRELQWFLVKRPRMALAFAMTAVQVGGLGRFVPCWKVGWRVSTSIHKAAKETKA